MFTLQNHRIILAFKLQCQFTCSAENQMLVFIWDFVWVFFNWQRPAFGRTLKWVCDLLVREQCWEIKGKKLKHLISKEA